MSCRTGLQQLHWPDTPAIMEQRSTWIFLNRPCIWVTYWCSNQTKALVVKYRAGSSKFALPVFWATDSTDERHGKMSGVKESHDRKLSPEQDKSSLMGEKRGASKNVVLKVLTFERKKDFKKTITSTLINQPSLSNPTSKPSMRKDGLRVGWFIDESGDRTEQGEI